MAKIVTFESKKLRMLTLGTETKDLGSEVNSEKGGVGGQQLPPTPNPLSRLSWLISKLLRADFPMA